MKLQGFILILLGSSLFSCGSDNTKNTSAKKEQQIEIQKIITTNPKTILKNLTIDYCTGRFEPNTHKDFEIVPKDMADREGLYLRKEVLKSYKKMFSAAKKDGVFLQIRSATRNFTYQKGIWERKWKGVTILSDGTNIAKDIQDPVAKSLKILEYSSMPGTSRHHWGTDMDLNAFNNKYFEKGKGKKVYEWLSAHASEYGFCQPYTEKGDKRPYGYNEEKWHWSYFPLSQSILEFLDRNLENKEIQGFLGAETTTEIDVVGKYILGINQSCGI